MGKINFVVTDVETGGLSEFENPITEVAMNICDGNFKTIHKFHTYVKPYNDLVITKEALKKSGVKMVDIEAGMDSKKLVVNLIALAKKANPTGREQSRAIIVGHNIGFDLGFYVELFRLHKKNFFDYFSRSSVCTMQMARMMWGGSNKSDITSMQLGICCEKAKIKLRNAHSAANDTDATQKLAAFFTGKLRAQGVITLENDSTVNARNHFQF